jgi:hypothetical protein
LAEGSSFTVFLLQRRGHSSSLAFEESSPSCARAEAETGDWQVQGIHWLQLSFSAIVPKLSQTANAFLQSLKPKIPCIRKYQFFIQTFRDYVKLKRQKLTHIKNHNNNVV